jgi:hypothetical protein
VLCVSSPARMRSCSQRSRGAPKPICQAQRCPCLMQRKLHRRVQASSRAACLLVAAEQYETCTYAPPRSLRRTHHTVTSQCHIP